MKKILLTLLAVIAFGAASLEVSAVDLAINDFSIKKRQSAYYVNTDYQFEVEIKNNSNQVVPSGSYYVKVVDQNNNEITTVYPEADLQVESEYWSKQWPLFNIRFSQPGEYQMKAIVGLTNEEDDYIYNNERDCSPSTMVVLPGPFESTGVKLTPEAESYAVGTSVDLSVDVVNNLDSELSGYSVKIYASHAGLSPFLIKEIATTETTAIAAKGTTNYNASYTFNLGGEYSFYTVIEKEGYNTFTSTKTDCKATLDLIADPLTNTFPSLEGATGQYDYAMFNRQNHYRTSQLLYPASYFGEHRNDYQLQRLAFTATADEYQKTYDPAPVKIYLTQTDRTTGFVRNGELIPEDQFTIVYDGLLVPTEVDGNFVYNFDLQAPFTLENGKGLAMIVAFEWPNYEYGGYGPSIICQNTSPDNYITYCKADNIYSSTAGTKFVTNQLPCLSVTYGLEPLPEVFDIEATSLVAPKDEIHAGQEATFRLNLANKGTVPVEGYTIELLNCNDEANPVVLETYEGQRTIAMDGIGAEALKYTFPQEGTYKLAARVILEKDEKTADNTTPVIDVTVLEALVPDLTAALTLPTGDEIYAGKELTFSVNVTNEGTAAAAAYTVELLNCADAANPVVLAKADVTTAIEPKATAAQELKYTFDKEGTYKLAARVTAEGDAKAENNTTAVADLVVKATPVPDLAAALTLPEGNQFFTEKELTFSVKVTNEGTAAAEAYTVELLDCTDTANPKVLVKADVNTAIAPAASATQELKYTFETSGEYKLAARVTTEGDAKAENNTTEPVTFKVDKYNGIDGVVAEGTLSFEGKVLRVNVGEGVVAVVDLAGRVVARYEVKGAEEIRLDLAAGIYVVNVNGRTLKIRI